MTSVQQFTTKYFHTNLNHFGIDCDRRWPPNGQFDLIGSRKTQSIQIQMATNQVFDLEIIQLSS